MKKGLKWIFAFVGAAIFVLLLRCFAITSCIIPAKGMENTLLCGDRILINKWSYGLRAPFLSHFPYHRWGEKRMNLGDIAVFNNPANNTVPIDDREIFISRCVGLPGDTLLVDSVFTLSPIDIDSLNNQSYQFYYRADRGMGLDSLLANYTLLTDSVFEMDSIYLLRELHWSDFYDIELNMEGEC